MKIMLTGFKVLVRRVVAAREAVKNGKPIGGMYGNSGAASQGDTKREISHVDDYDNNNNGVSSEGKNRQCCSIM